MNLKIIITYSSHGTNTIVGLHNKSLTAPTPY